ncbi:RNA-binding cell elongation regulator Jag/EloR [Lagierella sp.]|uniref:RNA-binding cell elongation regulator Jag/EloR n=1 Tax=Lagierella sp. TaxID=2849657 RepID=UPI002619F8FE|nr:RNA-binding cell elongation regulator Jag/EloR [Lagierella sp.]
MKSTVKVAKTVEEAVSLAIEELNCSKDEAVIEVLEEPKNGIFGLFGAKDAVVKVSCEEDIEQLLNDVISSNSSGIKTDKKKTVQKETKVSKGKKDYDEKSSYKKTTKEESFNEDFEDKREDDVVEIDDELKSKIRDFLNSVVSKMGIESNIETFTDDYGIKFNIIPVNENDIGIVIGKRGETLDAIQYIVNLVANRNAEKYIRISIDCNNYREKRNRSLQSLAMRMANKAKKYNKNMRLEPMNPYERRIIHSCLQSVSGIYTSSEGNEPYRRVVIKLKKH